MGFRASNLAVLLMIVVAVAATVSLTDRAQRRAADSSAADIESNAAVEDEMVRLTETTEVFIATGDPQLLTQFESASRDLERALAELDQQLAGDGEASAALAPMAAAIRRQQKAAAAAVGARRQTGRPGPPAAQRARISAFHDGIEANARLDRVIDNQRQEAQSRTGLAALISIGVLGALIMALGLGARRDARHRRRVRLFSEALQAARNEREAYQLVQSHLERLIADSRVAVFNRNNSADRLEPSTPLEGDDKLELAIEGAKPSDCLAIRTARPSSGGTGKDDLLRCEICGQLGDKALCVPSIVGGEVIGSLLVRRRRTINEAAARIAIEGVSEAAPVVAHLRNLAIAERRAASDKLTGLANKRSAEDTFRQVLANAARTSSPLALVLFDLDRFKSINDTQGHPKGDEVLAAVGSAVSATIRDNDFAARYGGEEFMVLLPGSDRAGGVQVAEKLRVAIEAVRVPGVEQRITASFGVAAFPYDAGGREELLRKADRALYAAKREGRNRVEVATKGPSPVGPLSGNGGAKAGVGNA